MQLLRRRVYNTISPGLIQCVSIKRPEGKAKFFFPKGVNGYYNGELTPDLKTPDGVGSMRIANHRLIMRSDGQWING